MKDISTRGGKLLGTVAMIALMAAALELLLVAPAFACDVYEEEDDHTVNMVGYSQTPASWSSILDMGVKADIWNYDPNPVFIATSVYVMLTDAEGENWYDQIGWADEPLMDDDPLVFVQYSDGSGEDHDIFTFYHHTTGTTWTTTTTGATSPNSSKNYMIKWLYNSGTHQIQNTYDNGTSQNLTISWTPTNLAIMAETQNFGINTPLNNGDHAPGHYVDPGPGNKIHVENNKYWNPSTSSWADTDTTGIATEIDNMKADTSSVNGIGFRVWDVRCND
jgi:hypothetical protein